IISLRAADLLVLKPIPLGGVGSVSSCVHAAHAAGVRTVITTSIDTGVGTAAALHLAAALAPEEAHGLATLDLLENDLISTPLPIENGFMRLPDGPGLGVDLDREQMARYVTR